MQQHTIICGFGRVGWRAAAEFIATSEAAARKIRLAGANRVVEPYSSAGLQIANVIGVGTSEELGRLEELFAPREARVV